MHDKETKNIPLDRERAMVAQMLPHAPTVHHYLQRFMETVGRESQPRRLTRLIASIVQTLAPPVTGTVHLTCADELEFEIADIFRKGVASGLTPRFGSVTPAPFRLSTLGGHYQWGAIMVAEDHYALKASMNAYKLLVVKINSHVGVETLPGGGLHFGHYERLDRHTTCCGALTTLLGGGHGPFLGHLRNSFQWDGQDRIAILNDPDRTPPDERLLRAAIASARIQARMAVIDIQEHKPASPTLYLVPFGVTFNRPDAITELLCGLYLIDHRGAPAEFYYGLADHPQDYRFRTVDGAIHATEDAMGGMRPARDHRQLVKEIWHRNRDKTPGPPRKGEAARGIAGLMHRYGKREEAKIALKLMLPLLAELAPVPAALLLFGSGVASIYHVRQAHRLAVGVARDDEARLILEDVEARIDQLDSDRAAAVVRLLAEEYRAR